VAGSIRDNTYKEGSKQILWPPCQCCRKENTGYLAGSHAVRKRTTMTVNSLISGSTNNIQIKHKISVIQLLKNFPPFMEPEGSLQFSYEPSTSSYPEPDQSSPYHIIPFL
jgi:hypothetical protein